MRLPMHDGADEAGHAGVDVNDGAAREVESARGRRDSLPRTTTMWRDRAGTTEGADHRPVNSITAENLMRSAKAPTIRAGVMAGEGQLEGDEDEFRNGDALGEGVGGGIGGHAGEEGLREAADEGAERFAAGGEGQRVAVEHPQIGDEARRPRRPA